MRYDKYDDYQMVLDAVFCNILIFDADGQFTYYNQAAGVLFRELGVDLDEVLYTRFSRFSDAVAEKVNPVNGKGRYLIDLDAHHIVCNVQPLVRDGKRQGTIFILHESMQSNCIMQELDVTNGLLQEINIFVESSHDGFMVTDHKGVIIRVNAAFEKAFSVTRQNVVGRTVNDLVEDGVYSESAVLKVLEERAAATVSVNKGEKNFIATGTPVFDVVGNLSSVVVNVRDITELNDLQTRLAHQRMVAEGYVRELACMQQKGGERWIVHSKVMQTIMDTVKTIAQVDSTILVTGESGTGKEVVVNQIHQISNRRDKPMIKINCGAIPGTLFESELFGYEEGAFTGARRKGKAGFFELANGGILFLDEIGELDMNLQVKLLRVIQEGEVTRIGGTQTNHVDVRIIAATNKDLWQQVQDGKFRQDLYYRLNVINIEVPPLRERKDDIIPLALYFLEKYNKKYGKQKELSMALGKVLMALEWPGNIRELENMIENMVVLVQGNLLGPGDLPLRYRQPIVEEECAQVFVQGILPMKEAVRQTESQLIRNAQEKYTTTRELARALGVDQSTICRKMEKLFEQ